MWPKSPAERAGGMAASAATPAPAGFSAASKLLVGPREVSECMPDGAPTAHRGRWRLPAAAACCRHTAGCSHWVGGCGVGRARRAAAISPGPVRGSGGCCRPGDGAAWSTAAAAAASIAAVCGNLCLLSVGGGGTPAVRVPARPAPGGRFWPEPRRVQGTAVAADLLSRAPRDIAPPAPTTQSLPAPVHTSRFASAPSPPWSPHLTSAVSPSARLA